MKTIPWATFAVCAVTIGCGSDGGGDGDADVDTDADTDSDTDSDADSDSDTGTGTGTESDTDTGTATDSGDGNTIAGDLLDGGGAAAPIQCVVRLYHDVGLLTDSFLYQEPVAVAAWPQAYVLGDVFGPRSGYVGALCDTNGDALVDEADSAGGWYGDPTEVSEPARSRSPRAASTSRSRRSDLHSTTSISTAATVSASSAKRTEKR